MDSTGENPDDSFFLYVQQQLDGPTEQPTDAMRAPDFIPLDVIQQPLDIPPAGDELPFGVSSFSEHELPEDSAARAAAIAQANHMYTDITQTIRRNHVAASYEVAATDKYASARDPGTTRTVLEHQSEQGSTHIILDTYGLTVDFFPADGSVPEHNHYYVNQTNNAVVKDTVDRTSLMRHIPPIGSVPHQVRERAIARARMLTADKARVTTKPVTPQEMAAITEIIGSASQQHVPFMELYALAQRRTEARHQVSDVTSEAVAGSFEDMICRHLERRGYNLNAFPFPTDMQNASIGPGEYMYIQAGYSLSGQHQAPVPTVMTETYIQLDPGKAADELAARHIIVPTPAIAFRQQSVTYAYDPDRHVVRGAIATNIVSEREVHLISQREFNADADDIQYANLFLQQQTF